MDTTQLYMTLYGVCVIGAIGLYLLMRPADRSVKAVGAVLGLAAVGWLLGQAAIRAGNERPEPFFIIFSVIAICSAVRMITHTRPVYSALYFVMVVLSSAALFLLLEAEFLAFALVIVYAGAILITYLFVLMLAQQKPTADNESGQAAYDLLPREPAMAAVVGFVLMALLGSMLVDEIRPEPPTVRQVLEQRWHQLEEMPLRFEAEIKKIADPFVLAAGEDGHRISIDASGKAWVQGVRGTEGAVERLQLPDSAMPENVQEVGLALVARFPVSLELAGVILLMAMFGAVVLARKQIELGEEEMRSAVAGRAAGDDDLGGATS